MAHQTLWQALDNRLCGIPLASKRGDLILLVAPLCIKEFRLVTSQLPEKFLRIGPAWRVNGRPIPIIGELALLSPHQTGLVKAAGRLRFSIVGALPRIRA